MAGQSRKRCIAERFNVNPSDLRYHPGVGWLYQDRLLHTSFYELQHTPAWATREIRSLWFSRLRKVSAMIRVGSFVLLKASSQYGLVKESFVHGDRAMFHVHYIDPHTGKPMTCPDTRCHGERTCPIHGQNCTEVQLVPLTQAEIKHFVQEGLIDPELLRA